MVQWIQDKWKRVCVNRGLNHKGPANIDVVQPQVAKKLCCHENSKN